MGYIKGEDVRGYRFEEELVCGDCATRQEMKALKEEEILTNSDQQLKCESQDLTVQAVSNGVVTPSCNVASRVLGFRESRAVFFEKIRLFSNGCWVGYFYNNPATYLISHPWSQDSIAALNEPLGALPSNPDCYYLHDLAVSPRFHGKGIGEKMFRKAKDLVLKQV